MSNELISQAIARQQERPDIHRKVAKVKQGASLGDSVRAMIYDLYENVPGLSSRQLSGLVGVAQTTVIKHLKAIPERVVEDDPADNWSSDNNESQAAAELAALQKHHPGGYIDQKDFVGPSLVDGAKPDDEEMMYGLRAFITAPDFRDTYRRADQSHTVKRPITLATTPFNAAA